MTSWRTIRLKEVCQRITVGHVGSMAGEYQDSGIPFLRSLNITPFRLSRRELKFIDRKFHERLKKSALKPGDVAVVRTGYPGTACVIPKELGEANCSDLVLITPGPELNPHFLAAIFNSTFGRDLVGGNLVGAAQQHFNITTAKGLKLLMPPKEEQDKIAAILTAYDDLIETNKRRIALLEKMAEEIYREWFVRMRFPDHQNTRFVKGVPEGWQEVELQEICNDASKSTKAGEHLSDRFYLPLDSLATKQMLPTNHYDYTSAQSSLVLFEKGDILFGAMRPYQHKVVVAPFNGVTRTTMFVIRPKQDNLHAYCYLNLFQNSTIEYATLICNGVDRPYVVWNRAMERMKVFLPKEETLIEFQKIAGPILTSIREFYFIQRKIAEARDLLLPRLISGKLSVEDLDIQFPPSMQEEASEPEPVHA